jgi:hypothetical protein
VTRCSAAPSMPMIWTRRGGLTLRPQVVAATRAKPINAMRHQRTHGDSLSFVQRLTVLLVRLDVDQLWTVIIGD